MRRSNLTFLFGLLAAGWLVCSGCSSAGYSTQGPAKSRGHGPPPHAPAHGYRAKTHDGVELVFRSNLGVYEVVGSSGYFYHQGVFFQRARGGWAKGSSLEGPWRPVAEPELPPGLRSKGSGKGKAKGHSRF